MSGIYASLNRAPHNGEMETPSRRSNAESSAVRLSDLGIPSLLIAFYFFAGHVLTHAAYASRQALKVSVLNPI